MRRSQILLATILVTGLLYIAGFAALGSECPTVESSGEEIVGWFSANASRARAYAWTGAFVSLGLVVFGGLVASLLPRPHRDVFLGGVLGCAITAQVQAWFWAGLALHPQELAPAAARTIFAVTSFWGPMVNASTASMAAAVAALGFGAAPRAPRWLAWLSVVFLLEQVIETVTVFGRSGFIAPGGTMNVYVGGAIGFLWVAGVVHWARQRMNTVESVDVC